MDIATTAAAAIIVSHTATVTGFVQAGETLFKTITGNELSANAQKVSAGILNLMDGALPVISQRVSFDLPGVLSGATEVLTGVNDTVVAAKAKTAAAA